MAGVLTRAFRVPEPSSPTSVRRDAPWRQLDFMLMSVTGALACLGLLMITSASRDYLASNNFDPNLYLKKQLIFVVLGFGAMVFVTLFDYRVFLDLSPVLYFGSVVLLMGLFAVPAHKGAHGWYQLGLFQFQPAEFTKIVLILTLAAYGAAQRSQLDLRRFVTVLALAGVPTGLIYLQPDLGTALVFLVIILVMLWVSGARAAHMGALAGLGVVLIAATVQLGILKQYQLKRLTSFVNAEGTARAEGYNVVNSKIAIGSGGFTGRGLFQGTQARLGYLPERHTDFIFSVIGEQLGLVGGVTILLLLGIVCWRIWRIATTARDSAGTLICVGVLALFLFQIFENVGMTMAIMPVTGIPLPFLSYGGSSTIAEFVAVGLVLNVGMHRYR